MHDDNVTQFIYSTGSNTSINISQESSHLLVINLIACCIGSQSERKSEERIDGH